MPRSTQSVKVYGQRKHRKQETNHFVVKWTDEGGDTVYMRWFKRDNAAVAFLNKLEDAGLTARLLMK
jgi:hypothetical protein